jgi:methylenetetrahydrofolate reductase (NADPH)
MSLLERRVEAGQFAVTTELTPPKGTDLGELFNKADALKGHVHGINLTESHRARMTMEPKSVGRLLLERGIEPIVQITARDRNRIAIQADLLGAAALGIENFVFMSGDSPLDGDHPEAKPVFDLAAPDMLRAAASLRSGRDMSGNALSGSPHYFLGAVTNPAAKNFAAEVENTRRKIDAGAQFLQTQAIYDPTLLEKFLNQVQPDGVAILAGIIPLKSAKMARWLNSSIPGIVVPEALLLELDATAAGDEVTKGIEIAGRVINALRPYCAGVHIMAMGWEQHIVSILDAGGVQP